VGPRAHLSATTREAGKETFGSVRKFWILEEDEDGGACDGRKKGQ
jgi:hypothetical protein